MGSINNIEGSIKIELTFSFTETKKSRFNSYFYDFSWSCIWIKWRLEGNRKVLSAMDKWYDGDMVFDKFTKNV